MGEEGRRSVPGDYDGDGRTDIVVYRPDTATWFFRLSSAAFNGFATYVLGQTGDVPVMSAAIRASLRPVRGDFENSGRTDITVFRPSTATWFVLRSRDNYTSYLPFTWGQSSDIPVVGDYDGDRANDITVFRPSTGRVGHPEVRERLHHPGVVQLGQGRGCANLR